MDKVRLGVIGLGNMGSSHSRHIYNNDIEDAVLTAVCDRNPDRKTWVDENLKGVAFFSEPAQMYKSGLVDGVIIATPHYDHPTLSMEALDYHINVLCEKPAGVYTKNVREMNEAADKSSAIFAMMFNQRTNSVYRKMKEMLENGELGAIRRSNWIVTDWYRPQFYYDSGDWRATWAGEGGGVLLNQCPHNLDLLQWMVGMPAKITAFCHEGKWHNIEVEDDVTAYMEFENGSTGVFVTSTADMPGTNRFEITGDKGKLVCENGKLTFYKLAVSEQEFSKTNTKAFGKPECEVIDVELDGINPQHCGVIQAFVDRILNKGELVAEGKEGINGLMISNAMHLSSWLNKTVSLPIDEDLFFNELQKRVQTSKIKINSKNIIEII